MRTDPCDVLSDSVRSLLTNKLRFSLSLLGIVIGVSAVTVALSVSAGANRELVEQLRFLGEDHVLVRHQPDGIPVDLAEGLRSRYGDMFEVGMARDLDEPGLDPGLRVVAVNPTFGNVRGFRLSRGRFIAPMDIEDAKPVCVLGSTAARALFGLRDPLGRAMAMGNQMYQVVGLLADMTVPRSQLEVVRERDFNNVVFLPLHRGVGRVHHLDVVVRGNMEQSVKLLRNILSRSGLTQPEIVVPRDIIRNTQKVKGIFHTVILSFAAVSIVVGGIGIMNILLVSVSERTREIGLRVAVGARPVDIAIQFLVESVVLATSGGVFGVLVGSLLALAVSSYSGWRVTFTWYSVFGGCFLAAVAGLFFGTYPALRAASLDPIQALRHE